MQAFITGSRAYGKPKADSDVDLVIRCSEETAKWLRLWCDDGTTKENSGFPCMFGRLNLIICTTDEQYAVWRLGTTSIQHELTCYTSEQAKAVFDVLRGMVHIPDEGLDSKAKKKGV